MLTKSRIVQLILMLIILLGLFFWRTFDSELDKKPVEQVQETQLSSLLRCDYQEACEFISEQGTFELNVKNLPIKAEEWIDFELTMPMKDMQIINAQIVGKTMFMGKIPVKFKKSTSQVFTSKVVLGACTIDEMIWLLEITVSKGDLEEVLSFDFLIKR